MDIAKLKLNLACLSACCVVAICGSSSALAEPVKSVNSISEFDLKAAEAFFARYVSLEREFNPYQAELYSPNAQIMIKKPGSETVVSGEQMQQFIAKAMPVARMKHDTVTYSGTTYTPFKNSIRIKSTRKSNLTGVSTPHLLVVSSPNGKDWLIVQEVVETGNR